MVLVTTQCMRLYPAHLSTESGPWASEGGQRGIGPPGFWKF